MLRLLVVTCSVLAVACAGVAAAESGQVLLRVNCGATEDYVDGAGNTWLADRWLVEGGTWGSTGGGVVRRYGLTVEGTDRPEVYLNEHYAMDAYTFVLPNGVYGLRLHFAETFPDAARAGARVFAIEVGGRSVIDAVDPFAEAGGFARPLVKAIDGVEVTHERLVIRFVPQEQNPEINGIEVVAATLTEAEASALTATLSVVADGAPVTEPAPGVERREVDVVDMEAVLLWPDRAPGAIADREQDRPKLNVLRPEPERTSGAAVIVCPGGSYWMRAMDFEGLQVCRWLNRIGVTAFLLSYRVGNEGYDADVAFMDGQRAVRLVRARAADYGVDPDRIGMIGFSAGGHLISRIGLQHDAGDAASPDPVERVSSRPDFLLFAYTPTAGVPEGAQERLPRVPVTPETPPTFIFHTTEDDIRPNSAMAWYAGLREAGVDAEMHLFGGYGPHGSGLSTGMPGTRLWPDLAAEWMRRRGFLSGKQRAQVEGTVTIDGVTMHSGWVTFVPVESEFDPVACAKVASTPEEPGRFHIPAEHGPVPGLHRVEVRHTAKDMLRVPSMEGEVLYTPPSPGADEHMTVMIHPGTNIVEITIAGSEPERPEEG
jgi:acetyl esterase/lipase